MFKKKSCLYRYEAVTILLATGLVAYAAAPVGTVTVNGPITPAASSLAALVTQPYCGVASPIHVFNLTTSTVFSSIPIFTVNQGCAEIPVAISPGLPGFPAQTVYVAYPNSIGASTVVASIPAGGGSPTPIATIAGIFDHVGLVFDTAGTYGGGLLIVTEQGLVSSLDSGGVLHSLGQIKFPTGVTAHVESPNFAPTGFGTSGGTLWVVNEAEVGEGGDNTIYSIAPGTLVATKILTVPITGATGDRAESLAFTSTCTVPVPGAPGVTATLMDALFAQNKVAYYNAPVAAYYNNEFGGQLFQLTVSAANTYTPSVFASGLGQQEHLAAPVCARVNSTGRWTGGGSVFETDGTRVTHGFEIHCDVTRNPNRLEINWGGGNNFHLETLDTATCFFDPSVGSPSPPDADFNTIVATGTGKYNGVPGATIAFTMTDAGEPGINDFANFVITVGPTQVLSVSGLLDKGNQQAHQH